MIIRPYGRGNVDRDGRGNVGRGDGGMGMRPYAGEIEIIVGFAGAKNLSPGWCRELDVYREKAKRKGCQAKHHFEADVCAGRPACRQDACTALPQREASGKRSGGQKAVRKSSLQFAGGGFFRIHGYCW